MNTSHWAAQERNYNSLQHCTIIHRRTTHQLIQRIKKKLLHLYRFFGYSLLLFLPTSRNDVPISIIRPHSTVQYLFMGQFLQIGLT
uniref:Uncharacterized protein n=1 Tax=Lepeophtheirus salmonis TaxID=72036 RepID=A0A0K2UMB0_LEPSM